ncbi:MAG: cobyrinate a,c-diamide synthase [Synergistaceae bacterium]|jgi:cobyrinic acid a,c-diamide synthase|nr:cobyrinate a,c-diamide synthase [Synergistaceae bacterium]
MLEEGGVFSKTPRVLIAGTGSGCGKTTFTCALMAALTRRGLTVQGFKCGPDYIDPMFHTRVTGRDSRNLDPFLLPEPTLRRLLRKNAQNADCSIIEGVMGFYDGQGQGTEGSSYEIAAVTKTPVLLVLNARGASASLAAAAKGFTGFRPYNGIVGFLLNGADERRLAALKPMLEGETGLQVLGCLPHMEGCSLESRHLGLVTAQEVTDLEAKVERLAAQAECTVDLERLLAVAASASPLPEESFSAPLPRSDPFQLAVARDEAFCFYYRDALDLLEEAGARLVFFSPLRDAAPPEEADGLYLGGGYPELHAARLSSNASMLESIRRLVTEGLPTFAECGGFMFLCTSLRANDELFKMSGALEGETFVTSKLVRFGYAELAARRAGLLTPEGWTGRGHEFHYSDGTNNGDGFTISKPNGPNWLGIHATPTLHAGYPHLHLCTDPQLALNFARACLKYQKGKKEN